MSVKVEVEVSSVMIIEDNIPEQIWSFDSKEKALKGHWLRHPQTPNLVQGRFGNPDEVAEVIANLCKKEADYINGQTLHVNGGSYTP